MSPLRGGGKALPCGSLPVSHVRRDYLSLISSLPDTDSHALFGLPANIEQSLQRTISSKVCVGCITLIMMGCMSTIIPCLFFKKCLSGCMYIPYAIWHWWWWLLQVLSQLRVVARAEGSAERFDREVWSAELSPLLNLWKKLNQVTSYTCIFPLFSIIYGCVEFHPQGSELITKKVSPPSDKLESPVLAFVSLERFNAVRLVQKVHSSLASLNRVLRGSSLLSTDVHRQAGALLRHEVRELCGLFVSLRDDIGSSCASVCMLHHCNRPGCKAGGDDWKSTHIPTSLHPALTRFIVTSIHAFAMVTAKE